CVSDRVWMATLRGREAVLRIFTRGPVCASGHRLHETKRRIGRRRHEPKTRLNRGDTNRTRRPSSIGFLRIESRRFLTSADGRHQKGVGGIEGTVCRRSTGQIAPTPVGGRNDG